MVLSAEKLAYGILSSKPKILKDRKTKEGYRAVVIKTYLGHNCGYVGITNKHKFFNKPYTDSEYERISVHGGVTFSELGNDYPVKTKVGLFWIGFDCAHYRDTIEKCNLDFCIKECESLSEQLKHYE